MMVSPKSAPAVVLLWLGAVGIGLALAALAATEPPVWDALSYVKKSFGFWTAVHNHQLINPFNLPMTVRPPGTILMSYPFGWSYDYHWFYFRSLFIPVALLATGPFIAVWGPGQSARRTWMLAALALALAGMPILYQFQSNETLPLIANWGLVDGFIAGVAAFAAACVVRSARNRSIPLAVLAAGAAAFTLWIKPAGLAVMGLTGLAWVIFALAAKPYDARFRRFAVGSVAAAVAVFAGASALAFFSEYFSAANIEFGQRALDILAAEYAGEVPLATFLSIVRASLGYIVPMTLGVGLFVAARQARPAGLAAAIVLAAGLWFWVGQNVISQVRYFLPFAAMAFVLLVPALLDALDSLSVRAASATALVIAAPALVTTLLVFTGAPTAVQRHLGVNLHVSDYAAENEQAEELLQELLKMGQKASWVYLAGTSAPFRNLQAVWDFTKVTRLDMPQVTALIPTDWQRLSTVRIEDLLRCDYIGLLANTDSSALDAREVADFPALIRLFNAWFARLDESDGVTLVSETRVKLLRVTDRTRFEAAVAQLEAEYKLPQSYRDANPPRWWAAEELAARGAVPMEVPFEGAAETRTLRAATSQNADGAFQVSVWFDSSGGTTADPWRLFGHLVDANGNILGNADSSFLTAPAPSPEKPLRLYTLTYPTRPPGAVAVALGFLLPKGETMDFLIAGAGNRDWDGKRVIVPLSQ